MTFVQPVLVLVATTVYEPAGGAEVNVKVSDDPVPVTAALTGVTPLKS